MGWLLRYRYGWVVIGLIFLIFVAIMVLACEWGRQIGLDGFADQE